jgi:uncharacterized membrane protein
MFFREFGPEILAPFFFFAFLSLAVWTSHVRKLAEINARARNPQDEADLQALKGEVAYLRDILGRQAIALDDVRAELAKTQATLPTISSSNVQERLSDSAN